MILKTEDNTRINLNENIYKQILDLKLNEPINLELIEDYDSDEENIMKNHSKYYNYHEIYKDTEDDNKNEKIKFKLNDNANNVAFLQDSFSNYQTSLDKNIFLGKRNRLHEDLFDDEDLVLNNSNELLFHKNNFYEGYDNDRGYYKEAGGFKKRKFEKRKLINFDEIKFRKFIPKPKNKQRNIKLANLKCIQYIDKFLQDINCNKKISLDSFIEKDLQEEIDNRLFKDQMENLKIANPEDLAVYYNNLENDINIINNSNSNNNNDEKYLQEESKEIIKSKLLNRNEEDLKQNKINFNEKDLNKKYDFENIANLKYKNNFKENESFNNKEDKQQETTAKIHIKNIEENNNNTNSILQQQQIESNMDIYESSYFQIKTEVNNLTNDSNSVNSINQITNINNILQKNSVFDNNSSYKNFSQEYKMKFDDQNIHFIKIQLTENFKKLYERRFSKDLNCLNTMIEYKNKLDCFFEDCIEFYDLNLKNKTTNSKLNLSLDIDNTLLHCTFIEEYEAEKQIKNLNDNDDVLIEELIFREKRAIMLLQLRKYLNYFFDKTKDIVEYYLNTHGYQAYGDSIAKILEGKYGIIFKHVNGTKTNNRDSKTIDSHSIRSNLLLIIDDKPNAWVESEKDYIIQSMRFINSSKNYDNTLFKNGKKTKTRMDCPAELYPYQFTFLAMDKNRKHFNLVEITMNDYFKETFRNQIMGEYNDNNKYQLIYLAEMIERIHKYGNVLDISTNKILNLIKTTIFSGLVFNLEYYTVNNLYISF